MNRDLYIKARSENADEWVRPSDWLTMPTLTSSDDEFVGLYAIFPNGNNFVAFRFTTSTGTYFVDWGDGNTSTVASGTTAEHTYDYATYDVGNTTLTSRGYKQAIISVTASVGLLRTGNFQFRRTTSPAQNQIYATGFLDILCSFPNFNTGVSFVFGGGTIRHSYLERFDCKSLGGTTSLANLFSNCYNFQKLILQTLSGITTTNSMFFNCYSLINIPLFDTSSVTDASAMFNNCYSIKTIPLFDFTLNTLFNNFLSTCYSLLEIPLINTSSGTNFAGMFASCYSLKTIPLIDTSSGTNFSAMFQSCFSLLEIPLINTVLGNNFFSMFSQCFSLQTVPLLNTASATNMSTMFNQCQSLNSIPALSTASITTGAGADFLSFTNNSLSIDRCEMIFARTVSLTNSQFSQSALVEIFNNLVDRTATTSANINITGNWGASALTAGERLIATSKNWTITG